MKTPTGLAKFARRAAKRRGTKAKAGNLDDVWSEVARRTGGTVVKAGSRPEVHVPHGPWTVIVDKHVVNTGNAAVVFTRTRAYFLAQDDLSFSVTKRHFFTRFAWIFGMSDLSVGDRELEERYVFRSKHASRLRSVMHDKDLRDLVLAQPELALEVKGLSWWQRRKRGSRVRVVTTRTQGVLTDADRIVDFVRLIEAMLDQLQRIGSAVNEPVQDGRHNGDLRRKL